MGSTEYYELALTMGIMASNLSSEGVRKWCFEVISGTFWTESQIPDLYLQGFLADLVGTEGAIMAIFGHFLAHCERIAQKTCCICKDSRWPDGSDCTGMWAL